MPYWEISPLDGYLRACALGSGQSSMASMAMDVPIHDSIKRKPAFCSGFRSGFMLAATMMTATVMDARRA